MLTVLNFIYILCDWLSVKLNNSSLNMSKTSLSDRLKNVEDEINEITSLMSLKVSPSRFSLSRSLSNSTMTDRSTSKSLILSSSSTSSKPTTRNPTRNFSELSQSRCPKTSDVKRNRNHSPGRSQCRILAQSHSDTKLKNGYASSRSSSDTLSNSQTVINVNGSGEIEVHQLLIPKPSLLSKSAIGDTLKMNQNMNMMNTATTSYDSLQTFLHTINNSIIEGNQAAMVKLIDDRSESVKCNRKPSVSGKVNAMSSHVAQYQNLMKEMGIEQEKRIKLEMSLEELKVELTKCREDVEIQRELAQKYRELSEQFEVENKKQAEMLKAFDRTNEEREMELELCKQKYESVLKDLKMEQEHTWILERDVRQMKDCLDKSQMKMQELLGARTMAVELAHDLQKKHQAYVVDYQNELIDVKNKNCELEKLLNESIREKNCVVERLQSLEDYSEKCKELQRELNGYIKDMADAEKTICELTRNPEGIPQVRHILSSQEQTFKAALTEKATSEMALQAKYTTLEVELQLIQDEFNKRLQEFEDEKNQLIVESEKKSIQQAAEIDRLKLVTEELTELSNQYKSRISELSDINKHQEVLIKCQNEAISSKEERNKLNMQEADLNLQRVEQEKKALILEHEKAINNLKKLLEEESDKLRVKDKIADDQTETIMQLKTNLSDKSKEVIRKNKEIQRLEQIIRQEKVEKENLNCDVQHLKMHRVRLNDTIADLQKQVEVSKSNNVHKKHSQMLEELEKKVAEKQSEWEEEISKLRTERDQARESAQYAIENLSTALQEHQKEVANHKELQTRLAGIIKEKEEQLNAAENKTRLLADEIVNCEKQISLGRRNMEMKYSKARQLYTDAQKFVN